MKLRELLEKITHGESFNLRDGENPEITDICYDSRKLKKGDLFVCVRGFRTDGHKYMADAQNAGAIAVLCEKTDESLLIPQIKVLSGRTALSEVSDVFFGHPSGKLKLIGITGSNGKSMTSLMTDNIFQQAGLNTGIIGTIVNRTSKTSEKSVNTTPESRDLHAYLKDMADEGVTHCTLEVSASGIDLSRTAHADFDTVIFNNISREHIDEFGGFENYFRIKKSFIESNEGKANIILNLEDENIREFSETLTHPFYSFGADYKDVSLRAEDIDVTTGFASFTLIPSDDLRKEMGDLLTSEDMNIKLKVAGYHNVFNSLAAILTGLIYGIPMKTIKIAIEKYRGTERRFELIFDDKFRILDDHFANPGNISATMNTLSRMKFNNLIVFYAIRGSRGISVNRESAETMAEWFKKMGVKEITATVSEGDIIWKDEVKPEEEDIFRQVMDENSIVYEIYPTIKEGAEKVLQKTGEGDLLLLAGCQGMDQGGRYILEMIKENKLYSEGYDVLGALEDRIV